MFNIQNIFVSVGKHCDLDQYKEFLTYQLDQFIKLINIQLDCNMFLKKTLQDTFWRLSISNNIYINRNNLYEVLSILFMRLYTAEIMFKEKKISDNILLLIVQWQNYCTNRFVPKVFDISNELVWMISSDFPVPEPDAQTSLTLYEESLLDRDSDLKSMLGDSSFETTKRISQFKTEFIKFFGIFENKCKYIERELARLERRNVQTTMHNIFQLNNVNDRTPPDLVRYTMRELIHIRNAIAHNLFTDHHNGKVRIRDKNARDELTYDKTVTIRNLWNFYYNLIIFDRMLVSMALFLYFVKRIRDEMKFVFPLMCGQCGYAKKVYLPPPIDPYAVIICEQCSFVSFMKDLMSINTKK